MKANDKWNPAKVPTSRPSEDQLNRSSMPLLGEWPSTLGTVETAGFSPDGRYYWTGGRVDKSVRVYEAESGRFVHEFCTGGYPAFSSQILPNSKYICTLDQESRFRLFDLQAGSLIREQVLEYDFIDATDISPNGQFVFVCYGQKPSVCFHIQPESVEPAWTSSLPGDKGVALDRAVFSSDSKFIVGRTGDGFLGIWRVNDAVFHKKLFDETTLRPVQMSTDNSKLLCLDWEEDSAVLLDTDSGSEVIQMRCESFVQTTCLSPNGQRIATGERDGRLILWNAATGAKTRAFLETGKEIRCLAFSPDGRFLLSGGADGLARLWNAETGLEIRCHEGHLEDIFWQVLSRNGRYLAYHDNTEVRVIDLETRSRIARIQAGAASDLQFSEDGQTISFNDFSQEAVRVISTYTIDGNHLYDKNKPETEEWLEASSRSYTVNKEYYLKREKTPKKRILGIPVSPGSTSIDVYRSMDDQIVQQFKIPYECKYGCQRFSPDGNWFIATEPRGFHIGNRETGRWELFLETEDGKGVWCVDISSDRMHLAAGLTNGSIRLWNLIDRCWVRSFEGHPTAVAGISASNGVLFSKDGTRLMTTDLDYTFVWDVATGKCLGSIFKNNSHAQAMDDRELEQFDEGFSDNLDVFLIKKGEGRRILFVYRCDMQ